MYPKNVKGTIPGHIYHVSGELIGVNGINISAMAVWLRRKAGGQFQFITLVPRGGS